MTNAEKVRDQSRINVTTHNSITKKRDRSRNRSQKNVTISKVVTEKTLPVTIFTTLRDQQNTVTSKGDTQCHSGHSTRDLGIYPFLITSSLSLYPPFKGDSRNQFKPSEETR